MKEYPQNSSVDLTYRAAYRVSGWNVVFNVWDDTGTLLENQLAATEVSSKGIYHVQWTTPNYDSYIYVKGWDTGDETGTAHPMIFQVGSPSRKFWYVHREYTTGQIIPYEIHDSNGAVLQSGNLSEVNSGYYYADASGVPASSYFRVPPLTLKSN